MQSWKKCSLMQMTCDNHTVSNLISWHKKMNVFVINSLDFIENGLMFFSLSLSAECENKSAVLSLVIVSALCCWCGMLTVYIHSV